MNKISELALKNASLHNYQNEPRKHLGEVLSPLQLQKSDHPCVIKHIQRIWSDVVLGLAWIFINILTCSLLYYYYYTFILGRIIQTKTLEVIVVFSISKVLYNSDKLSYLIIWCSLDVMLDISIFLYSMNTYKIVLSNQ